MQRRTGLRGSRGRDRGQLRTASSVSCNSAASPSSAVEWSSTAWRRNPSIGSRAAAYKSALRAGASLVQTSLLDFLR